MKALLVVAVMLAQRQVALAALAPGPTLPEAVTVDDVLRLLREHSPRGSADRARADVARAEIVAAAVLPNPSLSYSGLQIFQGQSTGAETQHQITVEQPLLIFSQRAERRDAAVLGVDVARVRAQVSYAERALAVRQLFATLLARQERVTRLEAALADLERVETVVKGRVAAGDKSRYDALRIEVESRGLMVQIASARAEADDNSGRIAALLGFSGWRPRALGDLQPSASLALDPDALWKRAQEVRPSLALARRNEALARGGIALARRERLPVPAVALGVQRTREVGGTSVFVGVSVPVPLFDRGQGPLARATADAHAAELEREAAVAEAHADLDRAAVLLAQRRAAFATAEREVMVRLPTLRKMAEDSYREGRGTILDLLDAFRVLKDARLAHLDVMLDVKLAEVDAQVSAGLLDAAGP